jgi:hypothetical protein
MGNQNQGQKITYSNYIGDNGRLIIENSYSQPPKEDSVSVPVSVPPSQTVVSSEPKPVSNSPTHCAVCQKKLKLADQLKCLCRCGNHYCAKHIHSFSHQCTFDYKKIQREKLENELEHVESQKVPKI